MMVFVSEPNNEHAVEVVVAESEQQAKELLFHQSDVFADYDLDEIFVERKPDADEYALKNKLTGIISFVNSRIHLFRNILDIYELDEPTCDTCESSSYGNPEYAVCGDCFICVECGGCQCHEDES